VIKKLLFLLAVLAALWSIPASRARLVLLVRPALEKLGPAGERVITPAHRYAARTDIKRLIGTLRQEVGEGRTPPEPRLFPEWANRRQRESAMDPWSNPYWMKRKGILVTIGSNGPDGLRDTADDISESATF
jgi:hypothetical protein